MGEYAWCCFYEDGGCKDDVVKKHKPRKTRKHTNNKKDTKIFKVCVDSGQNVSAH